MAIVFQVEIVNHLLIKSNQNQNKEREWAMIHKTRKKKFLALLMAGALTTTIYTGCGEKASENSDSTNSTTSTVEATATTIATKTSTIETTVATETTTAHISPTETVTSTLGTEVSDIDAMLDRDGTNTYNAKISDFVEEGDVIESFTFIVYAEDGSSSLGNYQGGYGISVTDVCSSATDENWYQSVDFTESVNSAYAEFTWNVPSEIQSDIDIDGEVMFGHWWSDVQTVRLSSIVCTYTRTKDVPVDGTNSISPNTSLEYESSDSKTTNISLTELIGSDDTLQTVTFEISSDGSLGKFTGAFGVLVYENADCATDDVWYQTQNICCFTDSSDLTLTWIIPDMVKENIDNSGDLQLGFWWSDQNSITLKSVSVRYSNSTGTTTITETTNSEDAIEASETDTPTTEEVDAMTSAEIVDDIIVGWNLGNSLDSYDTGTDDTETGWGNPKTTQAMFEAVQNAGFNAVRIPVTWGEHMSDDGTIDTDWMARVKEVVDYAYDLGLYVILNVHHDDYLWLTPTNDSLESDKATLTKIWEQICEEFQDYDHRLLFEGMNEPRVIGSAEEWTGGTTESYEVINELHQAFVDTVRSTGGENENRTLIVTTYAQSIEKNAINGLIVPDDDHIVVSVHSYAPWDFCGDEDDDADWGTDSDKSELDSNFQYLEETFISQDIPVIIDEFGSVNKSNTSDRISWFSYYISSAKEHGIKCFVWDNGTTSGSSAFGLLNRNSCTWYYPEIIEAIINAAS